MPKELPIHTEVLRARPEAAAVVHAHPRSVLIAGLAGLAPRAVFGAYNIPAMHLALGGVPVYDRSVLISSPELAQEMLAAMGTRPACILRGHGITTVGASVEQATLTALDLELLCAVTLEVARLGAAPPVVPETDQAELPDLGQAFNNGLRWRALVADDLDSKE